MLCAQSLRGGRNERKHMTKQDRRQVGNQNPHNVSRGFKSQEDPEQPTTVGLHWLRGSIPQDRLPKLINYLGLWFGSESTRREYGYWCYDRSVQWPNGVTLNFHSTPERCKAMTRGLVNLDIPGGALDAMDMNSVCLLLIALQGYDFSPSRIDLYFDDHQRIITPSVLFQTVYEEDSDGGILRRNFTPFRHITYGTKKGDSGALFDECAFGARGSKGSGAYLRVYDKKLESDGANTGVRWELELSDKKAKKAYEKLLKCQTEELETLERMANTIAAIVGGCIDFKQRDARVGSKNLDRLERYSFWQTIIDKLGQAVIRQERVIKSVVKAKAYIEKQVAGTLQMIHKAFPPDVFFPWLIAMVNREDRLRPEHRAALAEYERQLKTEERYELP